MTTTGGRPGSVKLALRLIGYNLEVLKWWWSWSTSWSTSWTFSTDRTRRLRRIARLGSGGIVKVTTMWSSWCVNSNNGRCRVHTIHSTQIEWVRSMRCGQMMSHRDKHEKSSSA